MSMCNGNCLQCKYYNTRAEPVVQNIQTETVEDTFEMNSLSVIEPTENFNVVKSITGKLIGKKVKV